MTIDNAAEQQSNSVTNFKFLSQNSIAEIIFLTRQTGV